MCESSNFTSIVQTFNGRYISLQYTAVVESLNASGPIEIICTNWRNPISRELVTGFSVLTYDIHKDAIDYSADLMKIDATLFTPMTIADDDFIYHLSHHHANELSDYKISFDSGIPISSSDGCFVKYTFPPELNTS